MRVTARSVTAAAAVSSASSASAVRQRREERVTAVGVRDRQEAVIAVAHDLGEHQIGAGPALRTSAHRRAKAGRCGIAAIGGDHEGVPPAALVGQVAPDVSGVDAVLDRKRRELARSHAEERVARLSGRLVLDVERAPCCGRSPKSLTDRGHVAPPGLWADRVAEPGLVAPPTEPVRPALLLVCPSDRKVVDGVDLARHDRTVTNGRPDHCSAFSPQVRDESRQPLEPDHCGSVRVDGHVRILPPGGSGGRRN